MVQILRDQMRDYQADVSGAIRTGQVAQNVGEWNQVTQSAFKIGEAAVKQRISDIMVKQAQEAGVQNELQKRAEQADTNIINTQIGQQANIAAQRLVQKQLETGIDPNSARFKQFVEDTYSQQYAPYMEKMASEKGRLDLQEMLRKGADKSLEASYRWYDSEKQVKAREASAALQNARDWEAKTFGRMNDIEGYKEGADKAKDVVVKHMVSQGVPEDQAKTIVSTRHGMSYIAGLVEGNPLEAAALLGADEEARDSVAKMIHEQNPVWNKEYIQKAVKEIYDAKKEASNQQLDDIFGADTISAMADARKKDLEQKLQNAAKGSQYYKDTKAEIERLDKGGFYDDLREDLRSTFGGMIDKSVETAILENEKSKYFDGVDGLTDTMNPDEKQMFLAIKNIKSNRDFRKFKETFGDEIDEMRLKREFDKYAENSTKVKQDKYGDIKGTREMKKALLDVLADDGSTPAQRVFKAFVAQNKAYEAPITETERKNFNTVIYHAVKDKSFADVVEKTFSAPDTYYTDLGWLASFQANNGSLSKTLPSGSFKAGRAIDAQTKQLYDNAFASVAAAATLPPEQRQEVMRNIEQALIDGKKKIYDNVVAGYGINLAQLDEQLKTRGQAKTVIGGIEQIYTGRDGNGNPTFEMPAFGIKGNEAREALLRRIGLLKTTSTKKAE